MSEKCEIEGYQKILDSIKTDVLDKKEHVLEKDFGNREGHITYLDANGKKMTIEYRVWKTGNAVADEGRHFISIGKFLLDVKTVERTKIYVFDIVEKPSICKWFITSWSRFEDEKEILRDFGTFKEKMGIGMAMETRTTWPQYGARERFLEK